MRAKDIANNHIKAYENSEFTMIPQSGERKYKTAEDVKNALLNGEIIPSLMRQCIRSLPTMSQVMASSSVLTDGIRKRCLSTMISALGQLGIK